MIYLPRYVPHPNFVANPTLIYQGTCPDTGLPMYDAFIKPRPALEYIRLDFHVTPVIDYLAITRDVAR
jgi:hypothetical protein